MQAEIEQLFDHKPPAYTDEHFRVFAEFKAALNTGRIRAASPDPSTVTGWRVNRAAGDSWVRRLSSRIANRVRNRLSEETIQDSGCTFRAFRRECLRDLALYKGFHRFIPTLLKMRGFRVLEVPVNHRPRRFGVSKYGIGNRALRAFVDLLVVRWMKDRLLRYEIAEDVGGEGRDPR